MPPPKVKRKIYNKVHLVKAPVWEAKFKGTCGVCNYKIEKGTVVTRHNKTNQIVHYSCVNIPTGF